MSTFSELVRAQFLKFVQEKNGGVPETQHEMEALFKEFQEQFNAKEFHDNLAEVLPLTRETAKTVYDWLELSEPAKNEKSQARMPGKSQRTGSLRCRCPYAALAVGKETAMGIHPGSQKKSLHWAKKT